MMTLAGLMLVAGYHPWHVENEDVIQCAGNTVVSTSPWQFDVLGCGELHIGSHHLGDDGAKALAEELKKPNTQLEKLYIPHNEIGDEGAIALADMLKGNQVLHTLGLQDNSIGDKGARALAEAISRNDALHTLDFALNAIGDEGATALAEAIKTQIALYHLIVSPGNDSIGKEARSKIAKALRMPGRMDAAAGRKKAEL